MSQLALALDAPRSVACSWAQSTARLDLPAATPCVLARGYGRVRDHVVRDARPQGQGSTLGEVPRGGYAWIENGARWWALEVW